MKTKNRPPKDKHLKHFFNPSRRNIQWRDSEISSLTWIPPTYIPFLPPCLRYRNIQCTTQVCMYWGICNLFVHKLYFIHCSALFYFPPQYIFFSFKFPSITSMPIIIWPQMTLASPSFTAIPCLQCAFTLAALNYLDSYNVHGYRTLFCYFGFM